MTKTVTCYPQTFARPILIIEPNPDVAGGKRLVLSDRSTVYVNAAQLAAHAPAVGDFYCVPLEGQPYLIAQSVFQHVYTVAF